MYTKRNIGLTDCQVKKLASAVDNGTPISFTKYSVTGNVPVYLTKGQLEGLTAGKPLKFSQKQLMHMKTKGGFLGALFKLIGPAMTLIAPVAKTLGPAVATGALTGAASYGANKLLRKAAGDDKRRGKGLELKPYKGGNVTVELTPNEINGLILSTKSRKTGGLLSLLASLAASLLPTLLGSGLSKSEINTAKDVILSVASQKGKKNGPTASRSNGPRVWQRTAGKVVWPSWKQGASAERYTPTKRSVSKPLSNYDIIFHGSKFPGFMGCFMRDTLPNNLTRYITE